MFPLKQMARDAICTQMAPRRAAGLWPAPRPESTNQWGGSRGFRESNFPSCLCCPLAPISPGCLRGTPQHPWVQVGQGVPGPCSGSGVAVV